MREKLISGSPLILLALLAALTFWLDRKVQPTSRGPDGKTRHDPDFMMEGFSAVQMNPDGTRRYALSARRLVHFPDDNSTELEAPRLTYFDYQRAPVTVRSETATATSGGDDVYFHGDVQVVRTAYDRNAELGLFTSYLHVVPDRDFAETDKPVRIVEGNSTANAVGLEFDNRTRRFKLLSEVKANYAISPRIQSRPGRAPRP